MLPCSRVSPGASNNNSPKQASECGNGTDREEDHEEEEEEEEERDLEEILECQGRESEDEEDEEGETLRPEAVMKLQLEILEGELVESASFSQFRIRKKHADINGSDLVLVCNKFNKFNITF